MPVPKMVKDRPAATWLACKLIVTKPNTNAANMPAAMPTNTATVKLPPLATTMKLLKAPSSIMPSRPKFKMPARSVINSPCAASSKGMAAPKALANKGVMESIMRGRLPSGV